MDVNKVTPKVAYLCINVGFHPKNLCCDGCPFCRTDTTNRDRKRCAITEEVLYETKQFGLRCPLEFEEEGEGNV